MDIPTPDPQIAIPIDSRMIDSRYMDSHEYSKILMKHNQDNLLYQWSVDQHLPIELSGGGGGVQSGHTSIHIQHDHSLLLLSYNNIII